MKSDRFMSGMHQWCTGGAEHFENRRGCLDATQEVFMKLVDALTKINKKSRSIPGF